MAQVGNCNNSKRTKIGIAGSLIVALAVGVLVFVLTTNIKYSSIEEGSTKKTGNPYSESANINSHEEDTQIGLTKGFDSCCGQRNVLNVVHHLVGYNETQCNTGCLYSTDVMTQEEICLTPEEHQSSGCIHVEKQKAGCIHNCQEKGVCKAHKTEWYNVNQTSSFGQFKLICDDGFVLNGFKYRCTFQDKYKCIAFYSCCPFASNVQSNQATKPTPLNLSSISVEQFTKQSVMCQPLNDSFIQFLHMTFPTSSEMSYFLECFVADVTGIPDCNGPYSTGKQPTDGYKYYYLGSKQLDVFCNNMTLLQHFQLKSKNGQLWYDYTCCI